MFLETLLRTFFRLEYFASTRLFFPEDLGSFSGRPGITFCIFSLLVLKSYFLVFSPFQRFPLPWLSHLANFNVPTPFNLLAHDLHLNPLTFTVPPPIQNPEDANYEGP